MPAALEGAAGFFIMISSTDIANAALIRIGSKPINSFQDNTDTSNTVAVRYDMSRQTVLRSHPWNCAMARAQLSPLSTPPVFGWAFQFQLPVDCLRVVKVNDRARDDWWRVEGRLLLTSNIFMTDTTLNLQYTQNVTNVAQFDALLCEAISAHLAWKICWKITQDQQLTDALAKEYVDTIRSAKLPDSQEASTRAIQADEFLRARLAGTTGIAWGEPIYNYPPEPYDSE